MKSAAVVIPVLIIGMTGCGSEKAGRAAGGISGSRHETSGAGEHAALFGQSACSKDGECLTGICADGSCIGFLMLASDSARNLVGETIRVAFGDSVKATEGLAVYASTLAGDSLTEVFFRARAVDFFRFLPCEHTKRLVPPFLDSLDEPVRFFAARSLALCGDSRGLEITEKFEHHESEAVRRLAGAVQ